MLFVFDKGLLLTAVLGTQELQFKRFFDIKMLSIHCVIDTELDLFDRTQLMCGWTVTANSKTIADLRQTLKSCMVYSATMSDDPQQCSMHTIASPLKPHYTVKEGKILIFLIHPQIK